jgi:hypothetical protein
MKYRIQHRDGKYWPQYRRFLRWHAIIHPYMGGPASFHTRDGAVTFIKRMHCNYLNDGGAGLEPRIKA